MLFVTLEHILTHISFSTISIVIMINLITLLVRELAGLRDLFEKGMISTFFLYNRFLVSRWASSGHFPLSNLYESLIFLSWALYILHTIPKIRNSKNYLNTITMPSTILTQGFATSGLLTEMHQSTILIPALQSQWLMHVSMMLLSYVTLLCGSLLSAALLIIRFQNKSYESITKK